MWAAIIVASLIPLVGTYLICVWSGAHGVGSNPVVTTTIGVGLSVVAFSLILWWWYRVLKRHGYVAPPELAYVRGRRVALGVGCIAGMAGIVALEVAVYAATRSRFVELAIAIGLGAPAMFALTRLGAFMPEGDVRYQLPIPRFQLALYPLMFVVFSFNLVMSIQMHGTAELSGLHEVTIAGLAFVVVSTPFTGYSQWKLYAKQQRARMLPT